MPARRGPALLRALGGTALATVLLVGVPVALVRAVGNPLPTTVASWDEIRFAVTRGQIDAWTWVKAFAVVAWLAWADLALSFLVELMAAARGRRPRHWAALAPTRWLATRVVAQWTLVASLAVQAGGPGPLTLLPAATAAMTAVVPDLDLPTTPRSVSEVAPAGSDAAEVEVGRRDTLWGLAEVHLGSGGRWEAIRDANVGRTMPDGTVLPVGFTRLEPGWTLRLPMGVGATGGPGYLPAADVEVERGDTLWGLADERLAALEPDPPAAEVAAYVEETVAGNSTVIDDPDLIFPGQRLHLPAVGDPPSGGPESGAPDGGGGGRDAKDRGSPAARPAPSASPFTPAPSPPAPAPTATADGPQQGAGPDSSSTVHAEEGDHRGWPGRPLALGVGGALLAAGSLDLVRRRRRYRMAHRRPGRVPTSPGPELDPIEQAINRQADLAAARWLDAALASLAARPVWDGEDVAQPVLFRLGADQLEVSFSRPDPIAAPLPWVSPDGGFTWQLDRAVAPADLPSAGADHPVPALVTVGEGVLVNLEAIGVLALSGIDDGPRDLLRSIVHELASSSSAGTIDIRTTSAVEGAGSYRLVRQAEPAALVEELVPWLDDVADRLAMRPATSAYAHRVAGDGEPFSPVVIVADWTAREELEPLLDRARARRLPLAVVLADPVADDEHRVEIDNGSGRLVPWDLPVRTQGLSAPAARDLGLLLANAAAAGDEPLLLGLRLSASVTDLRQRLAALAGPPPHTPVPTAAPWPGRPTPDPEPGPAEPAVGTGHADAAAVPAEPAFETGHADAAAVPAEPALETGHVDPAAVPIDPGEPALGPEPPAPVEVPTAEEPPVVAGDDHRRPDGAEVGAAARASTLTMRVLGPVDVVGLDTELTSQQLSLLCYLACNGPTNRATLIDALWDGQVISQSRFPNLLAELRARIGRHHFPEARDGRYQLAGVTTDLDQFERAFQLANRQDPAAAAATLGTVMDLVRGVPLTVPSSRYWTWVGDQTHFAARVEAMVADAAARLARIELDRGLLESAQRACEQGLLASPTDETLVVTLTEVYMAAGKPAQARRVVEAWEDKVSRLDCGEPSNEPRKRLAG
ncbi:MAG: LysM peptidoglycan-binding domain-containing protein [Acidimicrobiales bacterium]